MTVIKLHANDFNRRYGTVVGLTLPYTRKLRHDGYFGT